MTKRTLTWMDFIYPYVKSTQIFVYPAQTPSNRETPSYGYNNAFGDNYARQAAYDGQTGSISPTALTRTSEVVLVMDYKDASTFYVNPTEAFA